jgi:hypothetical protein
MDFAAVELASEVSSPCGPAALGATPAERRVEAFFSPNQPLTSRVVEARNGLRSSSADQNQHCSPKTSPMRETNFLLNTDMQSVVSTQLYALYRGPR